MRAPQPVGLALLVVAALALAGYGSLARVDVARSDDVFAREIRPILERYCFACHGEQKQKNGIRFDRIDPDMVAGGDRETWSMARDLLGAGDMPPKRADQPRAEERRTLVDWINASLLDAARALEEPPRTVLRRLTKAQYTNALQDLLGLSIDFGRMLPDDAKSEMGFTNNGEVLRASPLHLEYYQSIARAALDEAIAIGPRPAPTFYRVRLGRGVGAGHVAGTTGGYQAVPLGTDDFLVEVLDAQGRPRAGGDAQEVEALDAIRRRISVGFRGSSQDRFHVVDEGVVLYSALPHKEVAPGAWQGPSPNMKLEMQRVFPDKGDFELRVTASRGYLVRGRKELLVALDEPAPRASLVALPADREPSEEELLAVRPTVLGPWHVAGPIRTATGEEARDGTWLDPAAPLDLEAPLADGVTRWARVEGTDGEIQSYANEVGVVLLARVVEAPSERTMDVSLGSDDALWVRLNGEEVLTRDVQRGVGADQDRLSLALVPGRNELVLEIVNYGGGFASYHRVVHDGTSGGETPYRVVAGEAARVFCADRADQTENLRFEDGGLVAEDFPAESRARLFVDGEAGYYQFDLVHRAFPPDAMGSIRFEVGDLRLDLRPTLSPAEVERGHVVTPLGAAYLNEGQHEVVLGGPFFVGFSHLVMTPLAQDHPFVARLEAQAAALESRETPALRAFIGTRTDDGMDYKSFDLPREVDAPLGAPEVYTFRGRLENLPIPEPESGDNEILSGICVLGVWNDHLVKSSREQGPPLLVQALEFEAPYHPVWPPESHRRIFFEPEAGTGQHDREAYTREVIARFLRRAFRRDVGHEEVERYVAFWHGLREDHERYEDGVREVLVAALCSPSFLFLAEPELAEPSARLSEASLATRLAFFLWDSPPDERLCRLAGESRLRESLEDEVERMLADERSLRFVRAFTREWLRLDRLEGMTINPNSFPAFTRFVKRDLAEETVRFFDHVLRRGLRLATLVDSDFALLNQNLAEFYGIEGVRGVDFRPVSLPRELGRGGLVTQGAFLAGHSDGNEPHPIKRAVWVKEKLLGQPPLPPPPNVPDLDPDAPGAEELTLKEQIERHRDNPSCHDCHASFDPFGIALEGYNAVGLRETVRKGRPVDASTILPDGTEVDGAAGLKSYLLGPRSEDFAASLVKHLFAYALGRDVGYADEAELAAIREEVRSRGDTLRAVVQAIVSSPAFSER